MPNSYATSWKEPYRHALEESDAHKLTTLVQAVRDLLSFRKRLMLSRKHGQFVS